MRKLMLTFGCVALVVGLAQALDLPFESTRIVLGTEPSCAFAAQELNEIVKKATSQTFQTSQTSQTFQASHRIFIGRSPEAEKILGKELMDSLGEEESLVTARGNDLFLVGGDLLGVLWSVYDFVEDNLDYHWYDRRPGKDVVGTFDVVRFRGKETRRQPAFRGLRWIEANWRYSSFMIRNRSTDAVHVKFPEWEFRFRPLMMSHGHQLFLPPFKRDTRLEYLRGYMKVPDDLFKDHPEWYTLGADGKRSPKSQLCYTNPEMRDAYYEAIKIYIADEKQGGKGVYLLGVNDDHSGVLCHCPACQALDRKYDCGAGAYWEAMADFCGRLKRDGYDGVYLAVLAYRRQCEKAPVGLTFPDNFICFLAPGVHSHTLVEWGREPREEARHLAKPGEMYDYYQNAVEWGKKGRLFYWAYTDSFLVNGYKTKKELNEVLCAGATGAFSNGGNPGSGGGYAFGSVNDYLFLRLMCDPQLDVREETDRIFAVQYGPAAFAVRHFYDLIEEVRVSKLSTSRRLDGFNYFTGRQLAETGRLFDKARALVKGTKYEEDFDSVAMYVDMLLTVFSDSVARDAPDYAYDPARTAKRSRTAAEAYLDKWMFGRYKKDRELDVLKMLSQMAYYPLLKDKSLPSELAKYPADKVRRVLPEERRRLEWWWANGCSPDAPPVYTAEEDPASPCGWTIPGDVPEKMTFDAQHPPEFNLYEHATSRYLIQSKKVPMDFFERGKYRLFCLGTSEIRPTVIMNFGRFGIEQAIRTLVLQRCADTIYFDRQYEIWASVRAEGPMFFKEDAGRKNRLFISEFYVVDLSK